MKIYALAFVLAVCIFENANAGDDWRYEVKIYNWGKIDTIISNALAKIQDAANKNGTPEAQNYYEKARLGFRSLAQMGKNRIYNCVRLAINAGAASVCSQKAEGDVSNQASDVVKNTIDCINNTHH